MSLDDAARALEVTLPVGGDRARTVRISAGPRRTARVEIAGRPPGAKATEQILRLVSHILRLDEDLSGFYELARKDPDLAWAAEGAVLIIAHVSVSRTGHTFVPAFISGSRDEGINRSLAEIAVDVERLAVQRARAREIAGE